MGLKIPKVMIAAVKKRQWKDNRHMCFFKTVIMQEKTSGVL